MDKELAQKGIEIVDQIVAGLKDVAPQMADLTMAAVRFDAIYTLIIGVIFFIIAMVVLFVGYRVVRMVWEKTKDNYDSGTPRFMIVLLTFIFVAVPVIVSLVHLLDKYMWAGLVDPRVALAIRALDKALVITGTK